MKKAILSFCRFALLCLTCLIVCQHVFRLVNAITFDEVSSLHIWLTISSLASKDLNNQRAILSRQVEINWINAPLEGQHDYLALYLDEQANDLNAKPVSVHKLNGRSSGKLITDYYLPSIDFYNDTIFAKADDELNDDDDDSNVDHNETQEHESLPSAHNNRWNQYNNNLRRSRARSPAIAPRRSMSIPHQIVDECVGYCVAYHVSETHILASNCLTTKPVWMRQNFAHLSSRPLPSLMLAGTHNSGAYSKQQDRSVLQMINKYQMNQEDNVFTQLMFGIRYLDLRVGFNNKIKNRREEFWIYHDIFRTDTSLDEVFAQVSKFLRITSHEIVVMDFHRFTVGFQNENITLQRERHAKLVELLFKHLGHYVIPAYLGQHAPISEYVALGKRLVVGYADRNKMLDSQASSPQTSLLLSFGSGSLHQMPQATFNAKIQQNTTTQERVKVRVETQTKSTTNDELEQERVGTRLLNKLKSFKLITNSFSRRTGEDVKGDDRKLRASNSSLNELTMLANSSSNVVVPQQQQQKSMKVWLSEDSHLDDTTTSSLLLTTAQHTMTSDELIASRIAKLALFFAPVRHLWPNKDTVDGLAQYMNETTCRKYFGELRALMVELTPTVFGAISDKYDGLRRLAQLANRPVTDWIRDRWLHCVNIVASDYFLGNDLIRLSIYANKMRVLHRNVDLNMGAKGRVCTSFRRVSHLLDATRLSNALARTNSHEQHSTSASGSGGGGGGGHGIGEHNRETTSDLFGFIRRLFNL